MFDKVKNKKLYSYFDYVNEPWGKLFYLCVWKQIPEMYGKKILDFGSGFGITAEYLSENNDVIAVEPSEDMIKIGVKKDIKFRQITGGLEALRQFKDESFDCIFCHNVFEYVEDRGVILEEFRRLLKKDGFVSVIKHNKAGRIMQKAVFDYDIDAVKALLNGERNTSKNFGEIKHYEDADLQISGFQIEKNYGICAFYGLQENKIKYQNGWSETMLDIEMSVSENEVFRSIAFFHHIILRK